jgi:hypothetical protein
MTLVTCPGCSRQISDSAPVCPGCRRANHGPAPAVTARIDLEMEGLRAYVGPNWDSHYVYSFGQMLHGERKGAATGWTWNWAAALFPIWFLYRRLYIAFLASAVGWYVLAQLSFLLILFSPARATVALSLVVGGIILQGWIADRLLFAQARALVRDGTAIHPLDLARRGAPHRWVPWTAAAMVVLGICGVGGLAMIMRAERAAALATVIPATRADGWVDFQSAMGSFKAAFPHTPLYGTSVGARENRYTAEYRDGAVLQVTYEDDSTVGVEERFRQLETSPEISAEIRPAPVSLGEHPGMEATYEKGKGADAVVVHHRIYQVGGRLYQLTATMKKADPAAAVEVERFFSSFQLTSEAP